MGIHREGEMVCIGMVERVIWMINGTRLKRKKSNGSDVTTKEFLIFLFSLPACVFLLPFCLENRRSFTFFFLPSQVSLSRFPLFPSFHIHSLWLGSILVGHCICDDVSIKWSSPFSFLLHWLQEEGESNLSSSSVSNQWFHSLCVSPSLIILFSFVSTFRWSWINVPSPSYSYLYFNMIYICFSFCLNLFSFLWLPHVLYWLRLSSSSFSFLFFFLSFLCSFLNMLINIQN